LNRAEYENESAVLPELLEYAEQNPGPESYYQAALLAERIPYPDYMYEYARKYLSARSGEEEEEEIRAALFTSYMCVAGIVVVIGVLLHSFLSGWEAWPAKREKTFAL